MPPFEFLLFKITLRFGNVCFCYIALCFYSSVDTKAFLSQSLRISPFDLLPVNLTNIIWDCITDSVTYAEWFSHYFAFFFHAFFAFHGPHIVSGFFSSCCRSHTTTQLLWFVWSASSCGNLWHTNPFKPSLPQTLSQDWWYIGGSDRGLGIIMLTTTPANLP